MGFDFAGYRSHGRDRCLYNNRYCSRNSSGSSPSDFNCHFLPWCVGLSALFFAEFASRVPATGGAYSYLYAILGEFPAWLAGWLTMMEFMTAISGVASGWAAYFKGLLSQYGIALPQAFNGTFNPQAGNIC